MQVGTILVIGNQCGNFTSKNNSGNVEIGKVVTRDVKNSYFRGQKN